MNRVFCLRNVEISFIFPIIFLLLIALTSGGLYCSDMGLDELEGKLKFASGEERLQLLLDFNYYENDTASQRTYLYIEEALRLAEETGTADQLCKVLNIKGVWYYLNSRFKEAVECFRSALALESRVSNKQHVADVMINIGIVYRDLKDYETAGLYVNRALNIRKRTGSDWARTAHNLNQLGLIFHLKKQPADALSHFREALAMFKEHRIKRGIASALNNIGEVYHYSFHEYPTAFDYYRQALPVFEEVSAYKGLATCHRNIGMVYMTTSRLARARIHLQKAVEMAEKLNDFALQKKIYQSYVRLLNRQRDFQTALQYSKKYVTAMELDFQNHTNEHIARIRDRFELENQEDEIGNQIARRKRDRTVRYFLLGTGLLGFCFFCVLLSRFWTLKRGKHLLRQRQSKYAAMFSRAGDAILLVDGSRFIDYNEKALELFDIDSDQMKGSTFLDYSPPTQPDGRDSLTAGLEYLSKALNGEPQQFYWQHYKRDKTPFDARVSLKAIPIDGKQYILGIVHDISGRKKLEAERIKSAELETVTLLADGLAHDFNNLLTVITGNIELAKEECEEHTELCRLLIRLEDSALAASRLSRNFLTIAERDVYTMTALPIERPIHAALSSIPETSRVGIDCRIDIPGDIWPVYGDEKHLKRVFRNLYRNAVEAMSRRSGTQSDRESEIEISARNIPGVPHRAPDLAPGDYVEIIFADNGPGIHPDDISKIFAPYFISGPKTRENNGGLGLTLVRAIINAHEGAIAVSSQPWEGTRFYIYFPAFKK